MGNIDLSKLKKVPGTEITPLHGQILQDGSTNINWSDIQDKLIRLAAKHTERYASDLLIDFERVRLCLEPPIEQRKWYFGFRESGVDHDKYIASVNEMEMKSYYRAIWCLELNLITKYHEFESNYVEMSLYKVDYRP